MFKKMYGSLSMAVHIELLVSAENICLKVWREIEKLKFDEAPDAFPIQLISEKSLALSEPIEYMAFPGVSTGVYHNKLPAGTLYGVKTEGEAFLPNIPSNIRDICTPKLEGKYFRNTSYAWIDLSDPSINNGEKSDVACWVIGINEQQRAAASYNSLSSTYNTKAHPLRSVRQFGFPASLFVYQPFQTDNFTECSVTLKYNKGYGFSTNILDGWDAPEDYDYLGQLSDAMPHFTVTSGGGDIAADGSDTVEFKMTEKDGTLIDRSCEIYLESTGGYLPKKRIDVTNGTGSFKVKALGLDANDTFRVKIGFRNFTGITDVEYTVT